MTAAEGSFLGLAAQATVGTPNTTDADFDYLLFRRGGIGPNSITIPLGAEIGGGSMERSIVKVGVNSGGQFEFVPRPDSLGQFFLGMTGHVESGSPDGEGFVEHVFSFSDDQFAAPYFTGRFAPGNLWGEQLTDCRINALQLQFRGANFVSGQGSFLGSLPTKVSTASWNALAQVDSGPQFLAPYGSIELPTGDQISVLAGTFSGMSEIPLDEQYVVGNFSPEALDIVHRTFQVELILKVSDGDLYTKMMYDPQGGNNWAAQVFREGDFRVFFGSDIEGYDLEINGNGASDENANVVWTAETLDLRAQKQIVMKATGTYLASPDASTPITFTIHNKRTSYAGSIS